MATLDKEIEILMLKGESGGAVDRLEKTATVGNVDTYTMYMTDGATYTFQVTNGTSIQNIAKTSTSGLVDTYTITLTDGSTFTFQVTNGQDGEVTQAQLDEVEQKVDTNTTNIATNTTNIATNTTEISKIKDGETVVEWSLNALRVNTKNFTITDITGSDYNTSKVENITRTGLYAITIELQNGGSFWDRYTTMLSIYDLNVNFKNKLNLEYSSNYDIQYNSTNKFIILNKTYDETDIYKIVDCKLITPYELILRNPTWSSIASGGVKNLYITNPNSQYVHLFIKETGDTDYEQYGSIAPYGTNNTFHNFTRNISGVMYIEADGIKSDVVPFVG